jgi:hypothetical protein
MAPRSLPPRRSSGDRRHPRILHHNDAPYWINMQHPEAGCNPPSTAGDCGSLFGMNYLESWRANNFSYCDPITDAGRDFRAISGGPLAARVGAGLGARSGVRWGRPAVPHSTPPGPLDACVFSQPAASTPSYPTPPPPPPPPP